VNDSVEGLSAFYIAVFRRNIEIARILANSGANIDHVCFELQCFVFLCLLTNSMLCL